MTQIHINIGTVANDGTGDTIRGAFTNVNTNFAEVYNSIANLTANIATIDINQNTTIEASYNTANAAFDKANSANLLAYNTGISANLYSVDVGAAGNLYAVSIGSAANSYTQTVGAASNNYASILSANNAVGANGWANTVAIATNEWANSKFTTLSNTSLVFNTSNASFAKANAALANATGTLSGNLSVTGSTYSASFFDNLGPVREKVAVYVGGNHLIEAAGSVIFANNSNTISIKVPNDGNLVLPANVGTRVDIFQYGSGTTSILPNDGFVTVRSSNNWSNIAGQYLTVSLVKVLPNTWILSGNLKA